MCQIKKNKAKINIKKSKKKVFETIGSNICLSILHGPFQNVLGPFLEVAV